MLPDILFPRSDRITVKVCVEKEDETFQTEQNKTETLEQLAAPDAQPTCTTTFPLALNTTKRQNL